MTIGSEAPVGVCGGSYECHDQWRRIDEISVCNSGPGVLHRIALVDSHNVRGTTNGVGDMVDLVSLRELRHAVQWVPTTISYHPY